MNGYYHATSLNSGQQGWVYRTLVRKIEGDFSNEVPNTSTVAEVRVVDVGPGLCNLIKLPGKKYVIYDAGGDKISNGNATMAQIKEYIPAGSDIELLVLSHTDADYIVAAAQVIQNYNVKKVIWGGYERSMVGGKTTQAYKRLVSALQLKKQTENINLNERDSMIVPGSQFRIGNATFTWLCGFGKPLDEWPLIDDGERLNAVSIVMKMEFGGNSVLFCGDAVGRHREDREDALIATEHYLVSNAEQWLPSTIIIAPHHGAKNGSAEAFVDMVQPKCVIFSAGHEHRHPTTRTANQYLRYVSAKNIFRTDLGDDEGNGEWTHGRIPKHVDKANDHNIHVQLRENSTYRVFYVQQ